MPRTDTLALVLVLLAVPSLVASCRGRTVLDADRPKAGKKLVICQLARGGGSASLSPTGQAGSQPALKNAAKLWFTRADGDRLAYVCESMDYPRPFYDLADAVSFALTALLAGPGTESQDLRLSSEIPQGTTLIKVTEDKSSGALTVDLSRPFVQGGGVDSFEARLEQVRRTVAGVAGQRAVYLNVEGERLSASGDGLEVKQPISGEAAGNSDSN